MRWKGKAVVGFSARKKIDGGKDGGGDRDTELQRLRLLHRANRWGSCGREIFYRLWDLASRSRLNSKLTIDLCCGTHLYSVACLSILFFDFCKPYVIINF